MTEPSASPTLYHALADRVAGLIQGGALRPGDRVPSVRALAAQQRVSVSTVLMAYQALEDRGLIETRPQSGHYVRQRPPVLAPEPAMPPPAGAATRVTVSDLVARLYGAARDPGVVPLGAGYPSPDLLPTRKLNRMLASVARRPGDAGMSYDHPPGCLPLRRQIARRSLDAGLALTPDDIVTTVGASEAIALCLRAVTRPGATIALETPTYFGVLQLAESMGLRVMEIPTHPRDGLQLGALAAALRRTSLAACVVTPSFQNPLGCSMPEDDRARLVRLLARHDVPLIEDDIYADLTFAGRRAVPCKAWDRKGLVMLCSSFSKTLAPGYRVGWAAPGRFREQVERLKFMYTVGTPTLPQLAIAEFLLAGGYDRHLRTMRRRLARQVEDIARAVTASFPRGTRITRPAGGMLLWIELPGGRRALEVHRRALAHGVSVAPGDIFSARSAFPSCLRLNCGYPWSETLERAVQLLGRIAHEVPAGR